ncbi:MAG: helix-turn-helix transcriptional regulator, partial [Candidatus Thermoplasmatota archaeon]|nr:helix-turn-helix transcriptional regulator [Candidatus Thermoplasmatota archaeon]
VEEYCKIIFEEYEEEPVSHTTLWRELQVLDKEGLIDTETVQTKEGATTQIYIEDIPAKILEEFLIEKLS